MEAAPASSAPAPSAPASAAPSAAPAAPSGAPSSSATPAGGGIATPSGSATGEASAASAAPEASSAPSSAPVAPVSGSPEYDWKAWDGEESSVPETYRDAVKAANARAAERQAAIEKSWSDKYAAIEAQHSALLGGGDPRISEFETKYAALETEAHQLRSTVEKYAAQAEAAAQKESEAFVNGMKTEFPTIFGEKPNEKHADAMAQFLDAEWPTDHYSDVAKLIIESPDAAKTALERFKAGVPASYALEIGSLIANSRPAAAEPRRAAAVTAGAVSPKKAPPAPPPPPAPRGPRTTDQLVDEALGRTLNRRVNS